MIIVSPNTLHHWSIDMLSTLMICYEMNTCHYILYLLLLHGLPYGIIQKLFKSEQQAPEQGNFLKI